MEIIFWGGPVLGLHTFRDIEKIFGVPKSTFGDSLSKRCHGFFEDLCDQVVNQIHQSTFSRKLKKAIREVLAIDSSECRVHRSLFSRPGWRQKSSHLHTASTKLHVVWNVCGQRVDDFIVTPGRRGDFPVSRCFSLFPGKTYVFDRAYNDLRFWYNIRLHGSNFVTRLKNVPQNRYKEVLAKAKKSKKCRILFERIWGGVQRFPFGTRLMNPKFFFWKAIAHRKLTKKGAWSK